ncbi:glycosyltransferase [Paludibaculum fermentans]|uniref:Glycosyltransferase n=1 Tax=Paludibaculum fermentans TaxID=1473598 RepID=A0A7S7SMC3_PALFE|nr:glycosyltransferase [Paludibaculum fermentans]QOY89753.1 glycosyltransferase [Paludibaculum fermentans]
MKQFLKRAFFSLLGKEPEAVIAIFGPGPHGDKLRELVPDRRVVYIPVEEGDSTGEIWLRARRALAPYRVGLAAAPVANRKILTAACTVCAGKVLAFHGNLDRHHLHWSTPLASALFAAGVPLDRIWLRPSWWPGRKREVSDLPRVWRRIEGRPARPGAPKVAVLSPYCPYPLSHGGAVRIYNLLRNASSYCDVTIFAFEDGQSESDFAQLTEFCTNLYIAKKPRYREPRWSTLLPPEACEFYTPELHEQLRRELNGQILQVEYTMLGRYGGDVLVEHDVTWDLFEQLHAQEKSLRSWWDLYRWRLYETRVLKSFPRVVAMSDKDAGLLGHPGTVVIPNGVDLDRFQPAPEEGPARRLLFIGSFRHFPNVAAYRFFREQVWPLLSKQLADLEVDVVAGPDPHLYWSQPPGDRRIRLHGFVSDVRPFYKDTHLVLIPTVVSAGTNLKALEAMATQRAIVSTPSGVAGLGLEHGKSVWIADTARAFAEGIQYLLENKERRTALAQAAYELAKDRYGWPALALRQVQVWRKQ